MKVMGEITLGCPYCGNLYTVQPEQGQKQASCPNEKCNKNWHEGKFQFQAFKVVSRQKRGMGRNNPTLWNIRIKKLDSNEEDLLTFKTFNKDIQLKRGDIITLSFKKESKGLFKKTWTGAWKGKPDILGNSNLTAGWKI